MSIAYKVRPLGGEVLLPAGYRRCEYLESTGKQWIVTETFSNVDYIEAEFVFQYTRITGERQLFGLASSSPNFGINASGNWESFLTPADLNTHHLKMGMGRLSRELFFIFDGARKDRVVGDWWNPDTIRWICNPFALDRTGYLPSCVRSYGAKVTGDNNLLCNLIPCLDDKGKPCMYDTVSRTPYYNKGTGEFLYKLKTPITRKLPRGFYPLEYLESTGTQYIDTGVQLSNESEMKCEVMITQARPDGNAQAFFGVFGTPTYRGYLLPTDGLRINAGERNDVVASFNDVSYEQNLKIGVTNTKATLNDQSKTYELAPFETNYTCYIFAANTLGIAYWSYARIYSFSISRNGVLQLDFQPCLDPTGKPCMWDYVTRRPFYNQDTTGPDFLYG